ncbi:hypothetical protein ACIQ4I_00065 [Rummeliibacillus sp. NPDC094406]|uniref:hypothetical protein n=1 Tax=Rummeliibacillus sp. NPDC094406 TaxID=3364511 RepID=UPI00380B0784
MKIREARLITGSNTRLLSLNEATKEKYYKEFRGNLYCPTPNCQARIVFSSGGKPHFRTWQYNRHSENCPYDFDHYPVEREESVAVDVIVGISYDRRQKALNEAYKWLTMSEEEKKFLEEMTPNNISKKNPEKIGRKPSQGVQLSLFDEQTNQGLLKPRGPNLKKRRVSQLDSSFVGKNCLLMGYIKSIKLQDEVAIIKVLEDQKDITVVFEEAFIKEPRNRGYLHKFEAIKRLQKHQRSIPFTGIGEVRENSKTQALEFVIYFGTDFRIDNKDLYALAVQIME